MDTPGNTNPVSTPAAPRPHYAGFHWTGGLHLHFPGFKQEHRIEIMNVNKVLDEQRTRGDRIADGVAALVGSWRFIIIQSIVLAFWLVLNSIAWAWAWDPRPFILLNLVLSFQAAYSAPFILMSQNRQAAKDRVQADEDFRVNVKAEFAIQQLHRKIDELRAALLQPRPPG
jgi:uncharacterized membrane protein